MPAKSTTAKPVRNIKLAEAIARDGRYKFVIAGDAGVNPRLMTLVLQRRQQASPEVKARLARALGVDVSDIFEDDD